MIQNCRVAFNSGEVDEEISLRLDVDAMARACLRLENWEVSDMGGIRRRRGLKYFAPGVKESALIPFIYSYSASNNLRFLVEVRKQEVNVYSLDGKRVAHFESGGAVELQFNFTPASIRHKQINKLLILTSLEQKPWVIKFDGDTWEMEPYRFRVYPWRENSTRDHAVTWKYSNGTHSITFDSELPEEERTPKSFDTLRLSYWTDEKEIKASAASLIDEVKVVSAAPASAKVGDKFAVYAEEIITYWTCKKEFPKKDLYVEGIDDPGSYPDNFLKAEDTSTFGAAKIVASVADMGDTIARGTKFGIKSGYYEYYTCIKAFTKSGGGNLLSDYPSNFIRGIAVGGAAACKGAWSFFCSGLWYGSYEVRRNYESKELSANWETRGVSFSQITSASNVQISGTEEEEECYLRLFLTRSKYMSSNVQRGFPADSCDNKLIIESYKHDEIFQYHEAGTVKYWDNVTPIPGDTATERHITNWSWTSFSERYGYPLLCEVYSQRLIFASTKAQPQTIWASAVDDLTNFGLGNKDNNAMELTINDTSQNAMCWLQSQHNRLLVGTSEAEWVISQGQNGFSATSASISDHGHNGSDGVSSVSMSDKIIYVERGGGRVYEYGYSFETDGYLSKDLTQLAPHIARKHGGILSATSIKKPNNIAVFVLGDGQLALCTYNRTQQVNAWGRWVTNGKFISVAAMPNGNKNDLLFAVVERDGQCNIECYNPDENDYTDNGNDYESVMLTNALFNAIESPVVKSPQNEVFIKLGEEVPLTDAEGRKEYEAVQISGDGESWANIDRGGAVLKKGWHSLVPHAGLTWEPMCGIKVTGNRGFSLLCIQSWQEMQG